jgi:hypothetical protein
MAPQLAGPCDHAPFLTAAARLSPPHLRPAPARELLASEAALLQAVSEVKLDAGQDAILADSDGATRAALGCGAALSSAVGPLAPDRSAETRTAAKNPHPAPHTDTARMEGATQQLLARVEAQQEAAARISQLQALCGGQPPAWDALEGVAADVGLKAQLWRGLREWGEGVGAWTARRLFDLDVPAMEERVGCVEEGAGRGCMSAGSARWLCGEEKQAPRGAQPCFRPCRTAR